MKGASYGFGKAGKGYQYKGRPMGGRTIDKDGLYNYNYPDAHSRLADISSKLGGVRDHLPMQAAKVYHALQLALQPHSRGQKTGLSLEDEFFAQLRSLFPDCYDFEVKQRGPKTNNQWEVRIDKGPVMYCSVRMEILSDDPSFTRQLKSNARIVKDALLDNNSEWKRKLENENFFNSQNFAHFERECRQRMIQDPMCRVARGESKQAWVEKSKTAICRICKRPTEEDQLSGTHMCVVQAFFSCQNCDHSWSSYQGRLRPDQQTVIGQLCALCKGEGTATEWKIVDRNESSWNDSYSEVSGSRKGGGMHQSELCEACREFGNCMGLFYDPFILSTAISMFTNSAVKWQPYSEEVPELLYAEVTSDTHEFAVCLQPHVYTPAAQQGLDSQTEILLSPSNPLRGPSRPSREVPYDADYDRSGYSYTPLASTSSQRSYEAARPQSRQAQAMPPVNEHEAVAQNEQLLQNFVRQVDQAPDPPPQQGTDSLLANFMNISSFTATPEASMVSGMSTPAGEKVKSKNKISRADVSDAGSHASSSITMPYLDKLPPLRRKQFLLHMKKKVLDANMSEEEKLARAEEVLARCNGDYDKAFNFVRDSYDELRV